MGDHDAGYSLKAPGASGGAALRLPGRGDFPPLDDHLVVPEVTRDEIIKGRRVVAMPALAPHGDQNSELDFVLRGFVAPGYQVSTDLLTRVSAKSDFATDTSIRREGEDPATGSRYLEEIAFEVVSTQSERDVREKAEEMQARGVRRIFAVFVKGARRVCEWSPQSGSWVPFAAGAWIEDACLAKALPVAALLDAALADNAVMEALIAKRNPVYLEKEAAAEARGEARGEAKGEAKGKAKAILEALEERGIAVSPVQREEILGCSDLPRLSRWFRRALVAASAAEVTAEG